MKAFTVSALVTTGIKNATKEQVETALENFLSRMADELDREIEEIVAQESVPEYEQWESLVIACLAGKLLCTYSDAEAVVMAQDFYMLQAWTTDMSTEETALLIKAVADPKTRVDWQYEVSNGDTALDFFAWMQHQIEAEKL